MKALIKTKKGYGNVELMDIQEPECKGDEIKIKIKAVGICGTDLHIFEGSFPNYNPPVILGHEFSGEIIEIGKNVMAYHNLHIGAIDSVTIGGDVLIASGVYISDHSHGDYSSNNLQSSPLTPPVTRPLTSKPIVIGDNVWIGEKVSILPGVTIGDGVIIGAGSIVTKNVPSYTIAAGIPAVVIKTYNFEEGAWMSLSKCEN